MLGLSNGLNPSRNMNNLIFVDLNKKLVDKVSKLGIKSINSDYFFTGYKLERPVFMTASNPNFSMGGGIDFSFNQHFPELCRFKMMRGNKEMERMSNIVFTITVDDDLQATAEMVKKAFEFAKSNTHESETLLIHGAGTGIGGLSHDEFLQVIKEVFIK
jgi:hypothetical protein